MRILVTGGAGYIGSHTVLELLQAGSDVVVLDNLENSTVESLSRVEKIVGRKIQFIFGDVRDKVLLRNVFRQHDFDSVIHFAGLKSVGESLKQPLCYYDTNVGGTVTLCEVMDELGVRSLVFSSSATVYGNPEELPISEDSPLGLPTNPYGRSKLIVEDILRDLQRSKNDWSIALLRYFNPVGAHESGLIGEDPNGTPTNLVPFISQVAVGNLERLSVFGGDYDTKDGTGIRDYIHVVDLAKGHVKALRYVAEHNGVHTWNLGTGKGYSVMELIHTFEGVSGSKVPYSIVDRRAGDIAKCWADPTKAINELNWCATRDLETMLRDAWSWQLHNPNGYSS